MNLLDLYAKLTLDMKEYDKGLDDAEKKASRSGGDIASKFGGGVAKAGKIAAGGFLAAAGAVGVFTKKAVDAYGEYEQLAGGVDTLFKDAADAVIENANRAYSTAQLSANQYLDTVTSFSASLIQSLGGDTEAAAQKADTAIRDMSDNANKMGTDMTLIQNAYQGFAKQNYDMLDNLKLGYGGTQEEMKRLLADAEAISGVHFEFGDFADMVDAIHVIQEEMGIAGSSFEEATGTIQGSINMLKASWQNFLTGLGDPEADMGALADNLMASLEAVASNLGPVVERIFMSFSDMMLNKGPEVLERLINLFNTIAPGLIQATVMLIIAIVTALVDNIDLVVDGVMQIIDAVGAILLDPVVMEKLLNGLLAIFLGIVAGITGVGLPMVVDACEWLVEQIVNGFAGAGTWLLEAGANLISGLIEGIMSGIDWLFDTLSSITDWIPEWKGPPEKDKTLLRGNGRLLMRGLIDGIDDGAPDLQAKLTGVTDSISGGFDTGGVSYGDSAAGGLHNAISASNRDDGDGTPKTIIVQSVLDGRVIGETAYNYNRQIGRALGV